MFSAGVGQIPTSAFFFLQKKIFHDMKLLKISLLGLVAMGSLFLTSCGCCTGEAPAPPLRPLPPMSPIDGIPQVTYEK